MFTVLKNLLTQDNGQDLAEYGIALAVIAAGAAVIAVAIGADVTALWEKAHDAIHPGGEH